MSGSQTGRKGPIRWWRHRHCLRRIADLEQELRIWPPWHYMRYEAYDFLSSTTYYVLPSERDIEHPPEWVR